MNRIHKFSLFYLVFFIIVTALLISYVYSREPMVLMFIGENWICGSIQSDDCIAFNNNGNFEIEFMSEEVFYYGLIPTIISINVLWFIGVILWLHLNEYLPKLRVRRKVKYFLGLLLSVICAADLYYFMYFQYQIYDFIGIEIIRILCFEIFILTFIVYLAPTFIFRKYYD